MKTQINTIAFILAFVLLGSCSDKATETKAENVTPILVTVATVTAQEGQGAITASGKVEAVQSANISTRIMGHVEAIAVTMGQKVAKGQLLAKVGNADVTAKLAQVEAQVAVAAAGFANAEKDYERYQALVASNSASKKEWDDISTQYQMAKAQLAAAKEMKNGVNAQFAYANLRAPFAGVITNKFIKAGDIAQPGRPLFEIEAPGAFQVLVSVPESQINHFDKSKEVTLSVKSLGTSLKGKVMAVSTSAKNTGGQYLVKVSIEDPVEGLKSGMFVNAHFKSTQAVSENKVYVPAEAIITKGQLSGLYVIGSDNSALLRWLRVGKEINGQVEVLSGLATDESYVVIAEGKLYNGVKVSIQ